MVNAISDLPDFSSLSPQDLNLLKIITTFHLDKKELTVSKLLDIKNIGSKATIHARMLHLKRLELIQLRPVTNTSKKLVTPTQLALDGMSKIGEEIYQQNLKFFPND